MQATQRYVRGVTVAALINETIGAHFNRVAENHAHSEALVVVHRVYAGRSKSLISKKR